MIASPITTARISRLSPAHYFVVPTPGVLSVASGNATIVYAPFAGRLVDVLVYQVLAGSGGTSYTVDVKNVGGTSLLTATGVATLASGADKSVDATGELALPSGWTRPAIKTDTTAIVAKGARLNIVTVETGTYSTHATFVVVLRFEPLQ